MFISNSEKEEIRNSIKDLNNQVSLLLAEIERLKSAKPTKPKKAKKVVDPAKEEAARQRRREYVHRYYMRKKQEKAQLKSAASIQKETP